MSRRLLLPLLSALALLLVAAPATFAAPAASPTAHAAADDDSICGDGELAVESDDGTIECTSDVVVDDGSDGDVSALCDDDTGDDSSDDWSDDSGDDAAIATADDCDDTVAAPLLTKLTGKVAGRGRAAKVRVTFTLDQPGEVALSLARTEAGTTSGKRCVTAAATKTKKGAKGKQAAKGKAKAKGGKKGKRCSRTAPIGGTAFVDGDSGANAFTVAQWKSRSLKPGSYKLTASPTDGDADVTTTFTVAAR
ncbi:hypothetical protein Q5424_22410 [Conexibacter sp. JD483]|uniref:hypothetical protein n=1 Tax=unclassified Conexibacter TaxID=2627773 RepID=UPI002722908D|nr:MULTISPECIES: hypothetical protein [unclassified Conexibacter]MDO8186099.1 hypothetical protein [Conexibacter sp. CPCC 205706]MDO8199589.1 hypothetical protein [Conexibacter sp. CPCC 205762]MDR9371868.1 hypothetical protein [Conexibacter sp. JD483]